jgi:hypothetical protein
MMVFGQSVSSVGVERQTKFTLFDAAYERRPSGLGEGNDRTVRMVAVPHRDPAGAVRQSARLNATPSSAATKPDK